MKKRFFLLGFIFLFVFMLTGCADHMVGGELDVSDLDIIGIDNEVVDTNRNIVEFNVDSSYTVFDIKNISVGKGIKVKAKDINGRDLGELLTLNDGKNMFSLVFQFLNNTSAWTLIINKAISTNNPVESIKVISGDSEYVLNEEFKGLQIEVTYENGNKETRDVIKEQLRGFDTSAVGKKTITINFDGVTTTFEINVTKGNVTYTIGTIKRNYTIGEQFEGTILKSVNGSSESIKITLDMLSGFDNTKSGNQHVTITYESFTYEVDVLVGVEALSDDDIVYLLAVAEGAGRLEPKDKDNLSKAYERNKEDAIKHFKSNLKMTTPIVDFLRDVNLYKGQALDFEELIKTNFLGVLEYIYQYDLSTSQELKTMLASLDKDTLNLLLQGLDKLSGIFTTNQLSMMMFGLTDSLFMHNRIQYGYKKYDDALNKLVEMSSDDVTREVNNEAFSAYLNFKMVCSKEISVKESYKYIDSLKAVIKDIAGINTDEILTLLSILNKENVSLASEIDNVHRLAGIIDRVLNTEDFKNILDFYFAFYEQNPAYKLSSYFDMSGIIRSSRFILSKMPIIIDYLKSVDLKTLEAVDALIKSISTSTPNMNAIKVLSGEVIKLYTAINKTAKDNEEILFALSLIGDNPDKLLEGLILNISKLSTMELPSTGATEEQNKLLADTLGLIQGFKRAPKEKINFYENESILIKEGSTIEDFLRCLNKNYKYYDKYNALVEFKLLNINSKVVANDLKTPGLHYFTLTIDGVSESLAYYVYKSDLSDIVLFGNTVNFSANIIYFNLDLKPILAARIWNGYSGISFDTTKLSEYLSDIDIEYYLKDCNVVGRISLDAFLSDLSYELVRDGNDTFGLGALKVNTPIGDVYLVCNYTIVDEDNLKITKYDAGSLMGIEPTKLLVQYEKYDIIYVMYNYGYKAEELRLDTPLDTTKLGELIRSVNGIDFKFEVIKEDDLKSIVEIKHIDGLCNDKLGKLSDNVKIKVQYKNSHEEIVEPKDIIKEYAKTVDSYLEVKAIKRLDDGNYLYNLNVYAGYKLVKVFEFIQKPITLEEYEDIKLLVYQKDFGQVLADSEYASYLLKSEEEKIRCAIEYINSIYVAVEGYSVISKAGMKNVLDFLRKNTIPYHFAIDDSKEYTTVNLVIKDKIALSYNVVKRSLNIESIEYIEAANINTYSFYDESNLTGDMLKGYLSNIESLWCSSIVGFNLTKDEVNDVILNHIIDIKIDALSVDYIHAIVKLDSNVILPVYFKIYSLNQDLDIRIDKVTFINDLTTEDIRFLYDSGKLKIGYGYEKTLKSEFLYYKSFTDGLLTISYNDGRYEKIITIPANLDKNVDLNSCNMDDTKTIYYNKATPTVDDIIDSLVFRYNGSDLYGDIRPLLEKYNYTISDILVEGNEVTFSLNMPDSKRIFTRPLVNTNKLYYERIDIRMDLPEKNYESQNYHVIYQESLDLTINDIAGKIFSMRVEDASGYVTEDIKRESYLDIFNKLGYKIVKIGEDTVYRYYKLIINNVSYNYELYIAVTNKIEIVERFVDMDTSPTYELTLEMVYDRIKSVILVYSDGSIKEYYNKDDIRPYLGKLTITNDYGSVFIFEFEFVHESIYIEKPNRI